MVVDDRRVSYAEGPSKAIIVPRLKSGSEYIQKAIARLIIENINGLSKVKKHQHSCNP